MGGLLHDLVFDYTLRTVALGSALLGLTAGVLGCFAMLRRQSLLGDTVSHAALPGIALAFLLTGSKEPLVILLGAGIAGWLATLIVRWVSATTRIKQDAAMGISLSVFFGVGIVLLTYIQRLPKASQAGLETFLFGNSSTLLASDVLVMAVLGCTILVLVTASFKELKLLVFDADYARSLGLPVAGWDVFLVTLIVAAIAIGLQTVGVVLMSAMLVAPAAAARQWTNSLMRMLILAGAFGAASGLTGAVLSSTMAKLPTGPTVVLIISAIVLVSLLFAPARGIIWAELLHRRQHAEVRVGLVLSGMLRLVEHDEDVFRPHDIAALDAIGVHSAERTMQKLAEDGLVTSSGAMWAITQKGLNEARRLEGGRNR